MRLLRSLTSVVAVTLVVACQGDSISSPEPGIGSVKLEVVSGENQSALPGTELPQPLVALVTDSRGRAVSGQLVNFRVVSGGGSMFAGSSLTDRSGIAKDYWTLGLTGTQTVEVRAVDPTTGQKLTFATFNATLAAIPDADSDGFKTEDGDCNDADASINPGANDIPDSNFVDSDCDGIDGKKSTSVFVTTLGTDDATCGNIGAPCHTIGFASDRALELARSRVLVAAGTYGEALTLRQGISIHGGYSTDFASRSLPNRALLNGSAEYLNAGAPTGLYYAVLGESITQAFTLDMLEVAGPTVTGQRADGSGKHTAGILLRNIAANVAKISYVKITGGNATGGSSGAGGTSAIQTAPSPGDPGGDGNEFETACDNTSRGAGGAAGGTGALQGGTGGAGGTMDTDCGALSLNFEATAGQTGSNAATTFANVGLGSLGGTGGISCGAVLAGLNGRQVNGLSGAGGSQITAPNGVLLLAAGNTGSLGNDGTGGGGGGGAGGCDSGTDSYGAGGGGGGGGGVRAPTSGTGGKGGGASVGIYLYVASPVIENVEIVRGNGGAGGAGGAGGTGQPGSLGGQGGQGIGGAAGGNGGNGARGGYSGAGGGGAGGLSTGILKVGASTTTESAVTVTGGAAAAGGAGGTRGDNIGGGTGTAGSLTASTTVP